MSQAVKEGSIVEKIRFNRHGGVLLPHPNPTWPCCQLETYVMKLLRYILCFGGWFFLISATSEKACINTESLIGYISDETTLALEEGDIQLIRYHAFNAVNAIERSRSQLQDCGCDYARKNLLESLENLKLATQVSTLEGTRIPLSRAMDYILAGEEALDQHEKTHKRPFWQRLINVDTNDSKHTQAGRLLKADKAIEAKIEEALITYQNSLNEVVQGVPCDEALVFVKRVYSHCEQQLERNDQTPAKRFYNLRTKEITQKALDDLSDCNL